MGEARRAATILAVLSALFLLYAYVVKPLMLDDPPTVPVQDTREAAYRVLLDLLGAAGADRTEGYIDLSPGTCGGGDFDRHPISDGYYTMSVLANITIPDGRQHETFARLREYARAHGDDVSAYRNPPPGTSGAERRISASVPGDHGQRYGFTVFVAEPPSWTFVAVGVGCRRHPGPEEELGPYSLATLPPSLPRQPPIHIRPDTTPPPTPPTPSATATGTPLPHITDALG